MRILLGNVHFSPDSFGGATVIVEETAARLHRMGHEVIVFTATQDSSLAAHQLFRYQTLGLPVVAVKVGPEFTVESTYDSPEVTERFEELLDVVRPDVVHLHAVQALGVGIAEAALDREIPTVVTLHDAWWLCERQFMVRESGEHCGQVSIDASVCGTCVPDAVRIARRQQRSREILNRCSRVLVPSTFWRHVMVGSGIRADLVAVNANGVSHPDAGWKRPTRADGPLRIGYVGGLGYAKGSPTLIQALRQLERSDYELIAVDSASNLGMATMTARDWPVPGRVRVVPGYSPSSRDDFFGSIDALVAPSQARETYGLTVREATLRGVWVILPDGDGATDHLLDGVNATVYDRAGGVDTLAAALDSYLDAPPPADSGGTPGAAIPTYDEQAADLVTHYRYVTTPPP